MNRGITRKGDITHAGDIGGPNGNAPQSKKDITNAGQLPGNPFKGPYDELNEGFDPFSSKRPHP